jgi:hypothetical protein
VRCRVRVAQGANVSQAMQRTDGWTPNTRLRPGPPLFSTGDRHYDRDDVVVAAILRGEWHALVEQARRGLACAEHHRLGEEGPDAFDLEQAAQEFRYARNLITAEETEAWLARSGLTFEDWTAYLERSLLRTAWSDQIETILLRYAISDDEVRCVLHAEAVCSGELQRFAETLAGRAAACARAEAGAASAEQGLDEVLARRVRRESAFRLGSLNAQEWSDRVAEAARIEAAFQACRLAAITPEAVQAQILGHRLDWMRVRWRYVVLRTEQAAREAALCLRHEGESLVDVAVRAGVAPHEEGRLLESVDAVIRAAVVSARPGDVLGPWPAADGFRLAVLLGKGHPSDSDPDVRRRAEEEIATDLVTEAMKHVVWRERA